MNINERLRKIKNWFDSHPGAIADDVLWMHDTIKQLQETVQVKQKLLDQHRCSIAELEKENKHLKEEKQVLSHYKYMYEKAQE